MSFTESIKINSKIIKHIIAHKIFANDNIFKRIKVHWYLSFFKEWKDFQCTSGIAAMLIILR